MSERPHTGDILANAITPGVGAALAIAGAAYLITVAAMRGGAMRVTACSIYAATLVLVYMCSTLYHSLVLTRARHVMQVLDHSSIYLLIAGTYTPFMLVSLRGRVGWTIFGIIWGIAAAGVVFKSVALGRLKVMSAIAYLGMGWLIVAAMQPLHQAIGNGGIAWIAAGGAAYTLGIVFFAMDRRRYFHALWHVFVLAGSAAHYVAVVLYVAKAR